MLTAEIEEDRDTERLRGCFVKKTSDYNVFELEIQVILVDMLTTKIVISAVLVVNNRTSCVFPNRGPCYLTVKNENPRWRVRSSVL